MIHFDKIVNKMLKKWWKVIFKEEIYEMIDPEQKPEYQVQVDKIIYRLKSEKHILPIRNGVYVIPTSEDRELNELDLIEKYYYQFLKKFITQNVGSEYFICGKKSLEFHMKNYEIPEKILVMNRGLNKKVLIGNYTIIFKTSQTSLQGKKLNLFSRLKKYSLPTEIYGVGFRIAGLELALLEAALVENNEWLDVMLLNKALKKYANYFKAEVFYELWQLKYSMSFNRLKELSKHISPKLSEMFLDIIKKNGGLFIGEGLRKI